MFDKSLWENAEDYKIERSKEKREESSKNEGQRPQWRTDLAW